MKIDVFDLANKKITNKSVDLSFIPKQFYDDGEIIAFSKPVSIKGSLSLIDDVVYLDAELNTELNLQCSRCLERFNYPIHIDIHEKFSNNKKDDDEIILIENDKIDMIEVVQNNIILNLPIKKLCRPDCKGLCQKCGANLNYETCKCKKEEMDPRFLKLKDLFLQN